MVSKFEQIKALLEQGKKPEEIAAEINKSIYSTRVIVTALRAGFNSQSEYLDHLYKRAGYHSNTQYVAIKEILKRKIKRTGKELSRLELASLEYEDDKQALEIVELNEALERVKERLSKLPERDREIFEKRYLELLTLKEIAAIYGVTRMAIDNRAKKVLRRLESFFSSFYEEPEKTDFQSYDQTPCTTNPAFWEVSPLQVAHPKRKPAKNPDNYKLHPKMYLAA